MTQRKTKLVCVGWGIWDSLWVTKMLFLWRFRLGYWDWDAFKAVFAKKLWVEVKYGKH